MRVEEIMSSSVRTIAPGVEAEAAYQQMRGARVHHLAVMEGGRLVGVLSDRDLGGARGAAARRGRTAADLMTPHAVIASPDTTLRAAANLLRGRAIGCLPIVDGKRVVGIVTTTDLLELIGRGAEKPTARGPRWTLSARGPRGRARARRVLPPA